MGIFNREPGTYLVEGKLKKGREERKRVSKEDEKEKEGGREDLLAEATHDINVNGGLDECKVVPRVEAMPKGGNSIGNI